MKIHFEKARVQKMLDHSKAAKEWGKSYGQTEPAGPGLFLVGDQGVYLMDNAKPGLLADGVTVRDDQHKEGHAFVAYARECNPDRLAFDEWWTNKRASFGGDDGVEFIFAGDADKWIAGTSGDWLVLDISPESFKLEYEVELTPAQLWASGVRTAHKDVADKKPARFSQGDVTRAPDNRKDFVRGYLEGYAAAEETTKKNAKRSKTSNAKKPRRSKNASRANA